jgi:tetratricopeptide (TPR) repeat protein
MPASAPTGEVRLAADQEAPPTASAPVSQPEAAQRLRQAALRFAAMGDDKLALARLNEARALDPHDPLLLLKLGETHERLGQYDESSGAFEELRTLRPDDPDALAGLARSAVARGRYPEARDHLRRVLQLQPDAGEFWLYYGDVEHKLGQRERAVEAWQKALDHSAADLALRDKASERLRFLGRKAGSPGSKTTNAWPAPQPHRP